MNNHPVRLRLWASCDSITFDEFSLSLNEPVEVAFGFSLDYLGARKVGRRTGGFPLDLSDLGGNGFALLPELGRTACALTGTLLPKRADEFLRLIQSAFTLYVGKLPDSIGDGELSCEAMGRLHFTGKEWDPKGKVFCSVRILRFQSLCLNASDPRFGTWFDVTRYGDLGSDPDVVGSEVCVAEIELSDEP